MIYIEYVLAVIGGVVLDSLWFGLMKPTYQKYIGSLMTDHPKIWVAGFFYPILALACMVFVITPALRGQYGLGQVALRGALLGLVIYAAYDLTNQALIKNWSSVITFIDIAWGVVIVTLICVITYSIGLHLK